MNQLINEATLRDALRKYKAMDSKISQGELSLYNMQGHSIQTTMTEKNFLEIDGLITPSENDSSKAVDNIIVVEI